MSQHRDRRCKRTMLAGGGKGWVGRVKVKFLRQSQAVTHGKSWCHFRAFGVFSADTRSGPCYTSASHRDFPCVPEGFCSSDRGWCSLVSFPLFCFGISCLGHTHILGGVLLVLDGLRVAATEQVVK